MTDNRKPTCGTVVISYYDVCVPLIDGMYDDVIDQDTSLGRGYGKAKELGRDTGTHEDSPKDF